MKLIEAITLDALSLAAILSAAHSVDAPELQRDGFERLTSLGLARKLDDRAHTVDPATVGLVLDATSSTVVTLESASAVRTGRTTLALHNGSVVEIRRLEGTDDAVRSL